jgi:PAS domain S-box-containing protein
MGSSEPSSLTVAASGDHEADQRVEALLSKFPVELDRDVGIGLAPRTGTRVIYDDLLATAATSPEHHALLRDLHLGAAVIEPLTVRGFRVGAIACIDRQGRQLTPTVLTLLRDVAAHAAPVLQNARLHHELLERDRALRFSEAVLRAQGESGIEGLLVISPEGEMISHNSRFAEMWGFSDDILAGASDEEALAAAVTKVVDRDEFMDTVRAAYANPVEPRRGEVNLIDGRVLDRYGAPLRFDDGTYVGWAWYFRDITSERRAQQSLAESGERFATLARTLQESLLPPDLATAIRFRRAPGALRVSAGSAGHTPPLLVTSTARSHLSRAGVPCSACSTASRSPPPTSTSRSVTRS